MARYNFIFDMFHEEDDSFNDFKLFANVATDEEQCVSRRRSARRRGSVPGHNVIYRGRAEGHERLYRDYFAENPTYLADIFRRTFRMSRNLFSRIQSGVEAHEAYFVQRRDACGVPGLSSLQKITAALRMLAYGASADSVDDYVRIGESTALESLRMFVNTVVVVFGDEYLRSPNNNDLNRLLAIGAQRGFPGMLGCIDCMHRKWKNCPTSWHGQFTEHTHEPTIILEAVASQNLWIWHAFFGMPGSLNDINVLERSHVCCELVEGRAPSVKYSINGHNYTMGYYLADGIYPTWSTLVKTIPCPQGNKKQFFAAAQESARKDVERAFGMLQQRFAIVRGPSRLWDQPTLKSIMMACIIMHNIIIEDEEDTDYIDLNYEGINEIPTVSVSHKRTHELLDFFENHHRIRDRQTHSQLQSDLVEHLWERHGED